MRRRENERCENVRKKGMEEWRRNLEKIRGMRKDLQKSMTATFEREDEEFEIRKRRQRDHAEVS